MWILKALWFIFPEFIETEIDEISARLNTHYIRKSTFDAVSRQPRELLFLPESFRNEHRGIYLTNEDIVLEEDNFLLRVEKMIKAIDEEFYNHFRYVISQKGLSHPPRDTSRELEILRVQENFIKHL